MAGNFFSSFPSASGGGGGSGVSSLNTQTGALTLVAGSNITITPGSGTLTIASTGGGGGGITSINADATAAQLLVAGSAGTDFAIVDNGTGTHTFNIPSSSASNRGLLTAADFTTFNNKQPAGSYITALTGDATAAGPGSSAITFATVNSNVGSFTNANITVNAKGLITAASNGSGGSGADTALSNLVTTSISQDLNFISGSPSIKTIDDVSTAPMFLTTGTSSAGASGDINLFSGSTTGGNSGAVNIASGDTSGGPSGDVNITSGVPDTGNGSGGVIILTSPADGSPNVSGDIFLRTGDGTTGSDSGGLTLQTGFVTGGGARGTLGITTDVAILSSGVAGTTAPSFRFREATNNGSNYIALKAPNALSTNITLDLPTNAGTSGQVLTKGASNSTSWTTISGSGATTALDNLAAVAINTALLPGVTATIDLGDSTHLFRDAYLGRIIDSSSQPVLDALARQLDNVAGSPMFDFSSVPDFQANEVTNLADPTAPQSAATKAYVDAQTGGGGANVTLSNLTTTAVNADINPGVDNTINLGIPTLQYATAAIVSLVDAFGLVEVDLANRRLSNGAVTIFDWYNATMSDGGAQSADFKSRLLSDASGSQTSLNWDTRLLLSSVGGGITAINWDIRTLNDTSGAVSIDFTSTEAISISKHIQSTSGTPPGITPNSNAGIGATAAVDANATDVKGRINLTTGVANAGGIQASVAFNLPYTNAPIIMLSAANANLGQMYVTNVTTTGFDLAFVVAGIASTSYLINYMIME